MYYIRRADVSFRYIFLSHKKVYEVCNLTNLTFYKVLSETSQHHQVLGLSIVVVVGLKISA